MLFRYRDRDCVRSRARKRESEREREGEWCGQFEQWRLSIDLISCRYVYVLLIWFNVLASVFFSCVMRVNTHTWWSRHRHMHTQKKFDGHHTAKTRQFMDGRDKVLLIFFLFSHKIQTLKFSKSIYGHTFIITHTLTHTVRRSLAHMRLNFNFL